MELRQRIREAKAAMCAVCEKPNCEDALELRTCPIEVDVPLRVVADWGNEPCPHLPGTHAGIGAVDPYDLKVRSRRECAQCWSELKESKSGTK